MDSLIIVFCDDPHHVNKPKTVAFRKEMTLNDFRRDCSRAFQIDVVSMFTKEGKRISDTSEIETSKEIVISRHFYLRGDFTNESRITGRTFSAQNNVRESIEKNKIKVRVEIICLPSTGKTTLIQKFVQHDTQHFQTSTVVEAIYHQKLDISDQIVEFVLSDTNEQSLPEYTERLVEKEVVLIAISKQHLLEKILGGNFEELKRWVVEIKDKIMQINPECFVALILCKYDLISDNENLISEELKKLPKELNVIKTSSVETLLTNDIMNVHQLFTLIGQERIGRKPINFKKSRKAEDEFRKSKLRVPQVQKEAFMGNAFKNLYTCFRNLFD